MRHCRRSDFTFLNLLAEVIHGDVLPDITTEIQQDRIDTFHAVEKGGEVVVMFDLCCRETAREPKMTAELVGETIPVDRRVSNMVGVEISGSSPEFCGVWNCFQVMQLTFETRCKNHNLLS